MTKNNQTRVKQAIDLCLRTEAVLDFASLLVTDAFEGSIDGPLESFIDDALNDFNEHPSIVPIADIIRKYEDDTSEAGEALIDRGIDGMAVKFATPVRVHQHETSWRGGWSHYQCCWVYAPSFEAAWKLAVVWAEERNAASLDKFRLKNKKGGAA